MINILWVEDQPDQGIERIIETLRSMYPDFAVRLEIDAEAAVSHLKEDRYDLVILDVRLLPKKGSIPDDSRVKGKVILQELRSGTISGRTVRDVPCIIFSAIINQKDKTEIMSVSPPPLAYFEKPVALRDFISVIHGHFGGAR
ncbi:MAG: hypothetical protein HZC49_11465 [Nitrospirae bacterium]|nr:hypothetical protein [Nitrospirota bacterium]